MIGVVALQGGVAPHLRRLEALGQPAMEVRTPDALAHVEAIVFPGGESSSQALLIEAAGMTGALQAAIATKPTLATCAGLILVARWGLLDVDVRRNGYGSQAHSFEATSDGGRPLVFIRAPRITRVGAVEVLDTLQGEPIAVRSGHLTAMCHHPELAPPDPEDRWWTVPSGDRSDHLRPKEALGQLRVANAGGHLR